MKSRGFSIVELLVCMAAIAIITAITLPPLVRERIADREAEVKANIHQIQIALERYAVDSGGSYPTYLVGAERSSNILQCYAEHSSASSWPTSGMTPFAPESRMIPGNGCAGPMKAPLMDPLIRWGYLSEYPVNPFARPDSGLWNSQAPLHGSPGLYPYGGEHGDKMFDLGFGWGDTPQTDFVLFTTEAIDERNGYNDPSAVSDPDLDAPGNFYYHPIFFYDAPVFFHYALAHQRAIGYSGQSIRESDVIDYFLYGYGGPGSKDSFEEGGGDYFNRMPANHEMSEIGLERARKFAMSAYSFDTSVGAANQARVETTGYTAFEFDPWTGAFPGGVDPLNHANENPESGPDGVNDWVIIEVSSGIHALSPPDSNSQTKETEQ